MSSRAASSIADCPYCRFSYSDVLLSIDEIKKYHDRKLTKLSIREAPDQQLIRFPSLGGQDQGCPHLLQITLSLFCSAIKDRRRGETEWCLDIEWWHDLMDGQNNSLMYYIYEELLPQAAEEKSSKVGVVTAHDVNVIWSARLPTDPNKMYSCSGTVLFANDIVSLKEAARWWEASRYYRPSNN